MKPGILIVHMEAMYLR